MKIPHYMDLLLVTIAGLFIYWVCSGWVPENGSVVRGQKTVDTVINEIGPVSESKLKQIFAQANFTYPPERISLIAIKDTQMLEIWAHHNGQSKKIQSFPIQAASGVLGPKLREGDFQVPEGIYRISAFNPNSAYHLSMKLNFPNAFDLKYAHLEGRTEPGSDIFIHGKAVSIGCLAMGDEVIELLFTLVHQVGRSHTEVVIAPTDPELGALQVPEGAAQWVHILYQNLTAKITEIRG